MKLLTLVFIHLLSLTVLFGQSQRGSNKYTTILENIEGRWLSKNDTIIIKDTIWNILSKGRSTSYKLQLKTVVEDTSPNIPFELIYLCKTCKSFTKEETVPEDEIIIYSIYSINALQLVFKDLLSQETIKLDKLE